MSVESQSASFAKTLVIGISLMLAVGLAGCSSTREKDAEDAEAAAARSQASAERAEAAADKALEASAAAMKAADHAAAAVKEATKEMDRVSAHLEQLQKEREEEEDAEDEAVKPRHRKKAARRTKAAQRHRGGPGAGGAAFACEIAISSPRGSAYARRLEILSSRRRRKPDSRANRGAPARGRGSRPDPRAQDSPSCMAQHRGSARRGDHRDHARRVLQKSDRSVAIRAVHRARMVRRPEIRSRPRHGPDDLLHQRRLSRHGAGHHDSWARPQCRAGVARRDGPHRAGPLQGDGAQPVRFRRLGASANRSFDRVPGGRHRQVHRPDENRQGQSDRMGRRRRCRALLRGRSSRQSGAIDPGLGWPVW